MFNPSEYITSHPYTAAGIGVVALVGVFYLTRGSSASTATTTTDPNAQYIGAELQAAQQQAQITAQTNQATLQYNAQLAINNQQNANSQALATIQAQSQGQAQSIQAQVADTLAQYQYELGVLTSNNNLTAQEVQAQTDQNTVNTQGAVSLAQIAAQENINNTIQQAGVTTTALNDQTQTQIAGIVAQTQQHLGDTQAQVAIAQSANQLGAIQAVSNTQIQIAQTAAKAQTTGGVLGLIGSIFG